ncbi:DUF4129 domain-containing protein [Vulcanisaeta thermophila]|uniref:DUF4129 domain-containing protein n=1 Tax=Vulcanisaeta thermophila TaxID=867917 RepID=UPI0008538B70|nr:DUF4129 domain-containing protein [Vulcanisaeta thermophila]
MRRDAIIILIIGLVLTWLLASSINIIKVQPRPGEAQGGSIRVPTIPLPNLLPTPPLVNTSIYIPTNFSMPIFNGFVTIPLVPVPVVMFNMPINLSIGVPRIGQGGRGYVGGGLGGGSGAGASRGTGSAGNYVTTTPTPMPLPSTLLTILLIALLGLSVILGVISARSIKASLSTTRGVSRVGQTINANAAKPALKPRENASRGTVINYDMGVSLMPHEVISPLRGWGGSSLIMFPVPTDLPLIWSVGDMPIKVVDGVTISVSPGAHVDSGLIRWLGPGCYEVRVSYGPHVERWFVRVVDYGDDVIRLMRINNPLGNASMTIREELLRWARDNNVDGDLVMRLIRVFEDARYGLKPVGKGEYEEYLRALGRVFPNARVITCAQ